MSYSEQLVATGKATNVVWDFPSLSTRFVSRVTDDLDTPAGWTVFAGAVNRGDDGSRIDIRRGSITAGGSEFVMPDLAEAVTMWLAANDATLRYAAVIRRDGFDGAPEAEWNITRWQLDDWAVQGKAGGAYRFELVNALRSLQSSLFEDVEGESFRLATGGGDLAPGTTTITLEESPKGEWREPGAALIYSAESKLCELIEYVSIGGTGDKDLETVTRRKFAVGDAAHTFTVDETEIFECWARRGNPLTLALQLATTTGAAGTATPAELMLNPDFDDWTASVIDDWTEVETGGSADELVSGALKGSGVKLTRTTLGALNVSQAKTSGIFPGQWGFVSVMARASEAGSGLLSITIRNSTASEDLQADGTWAAGTYLHMFDLTTEWRRCTVVFQFDGSHSASDTLRLFFAHGDQNNNVEVDLDTICTPLACAPFDSEPSGPFDQGDGDGIGLDSDFIDIDTFERIRQEFWPEPVFDGSDALTSGSAVLFVETSPIDDFKSWFEDHICRAFGLYPITGADERLAVETYFRLLPVPVAIGKEWRVDNFSASGFRRNFADRINNLSLLSDWNPAESKHALSTPKVSDASIERFGKAKAEPVASRGGRTGRLGFPDYGSADDLNSAGGRLLLEAANPGTPLKVEAFYSHKDLALAQVVSIEISDSIPNLLTGFRGIGEETSFLIDRRRVRLDPERERAFVELSLRARRPLTRPGVVAPNSAASTYTLATSTDRQSTYISPDSGQFSNGDEAYTVAF